MGTTRRDVTRRPRKGRSEKNMARKDERRRREAVAREDPQDDEEDNEDSGENVMPRTRLEPIRRSEPKIKRNDPCHCGSGKKHKKCCGFMA